MPFPNQHAARQANPKGFVRFRQGKLKGAPAGVSVVFGVKKDGKSEIQSVRFDSKKFTVAQAKAWLKGKGFKTGVEAASGKKTNKSAWAHTVEIKKVDEDQRLVFGWWYTARDPDALVADPEHIMDDGTVVDHSGDTLSVEEMEKMSYAYVRDSRAGRNMHKGEPVAVLVEGVVFTPEKRAMMGIPDGILPDAAWGGWFVHDDDTWGRIKSGELSELSFGGTGIREEV